MLDALSFPLSMAGISGAKAAFSHRELEDSLRISQFRQTRRGY